MSVARSGGLTCTDHSQIVGGREDLHAPRHRVLAVFRSPYLTLPGKPVAVAGRPRGRRVRLLLFAMAAVGMLAVVIVAATAAIVFSGATEIGLIRDRVRAALSERLGPEFSVSVGRTVMSVDPELGLVIDIEAVEVSNPDGEMVLAVPVTRLAVDALSLVGLKIVVTKAEVSAPSLALVADPRGGYRLDGPASEARGTSRTGDSGAVAHTAGACLPRDSGGCPGDRSRAGRHRLDPGRGRTRPPDRARSRGTPRSRERYCSRGRRHRSRRRSRRRGRHPESRGFRTWQRWPLERNAEAAHRGRHRRPALLDELLGTDAWRHLPGSRRVGRVGEHRHRRSTEVPNSSSAAAASKVPTAGSTWERASSILGTAMRAS